jgi:hypothetical protein
MCKGAALFSPIIFIIYHDENFEFFFVFRLLGGKKGKKIKRKQRCQNVIGSLEKYFCKNIYRKLY